MAKGKDRKNRILAFLGRYWVTVWLAVACLLLGVTGTLAAYKYRQYAKAVARNNVSGGIQFSSDILEQEIYNKDILLDYESYGSDPKYIYYSTVEGTASPSATFTVCSYPQSNPSSYNSSDITYDLYVSVVLKDSAEITDIGSLCTLSAGTYGTVVLKEGSQLAFEGMTLSQLAGRTCDSYRLTVDKSVADYVEIAVEAVPREDSLDAAGNKLLCRKFLFAEYGSSTTKWHGAFSETADDTYWAYNYEISGTSITDVVLMWNAEIIALSKWSVENLGGESYTEDVPDGWEAVKFSAGDNGISSYTVQFYRAEGNYSNESPDEDWASVKEISVDE